MLNLNKIKGHLTNRKGVRAEKNYMDKNKECEISAGFWNVNGKIRLHIIDYDIDLVEDYGGPFEFGAPLKRDEIKDFTTVEETTNYILQTTILTEDDFPHKFKIKPKEPTK